MAVTAQDIRILGFVPEIDRDSGIWKSIYIQGVRVTAYPDGSPGPDEAFGFQVQFADFSTAMSAANPAMAGVDLVTPIMTAGYNLAVAHVNEGMTP
jgi:hypothetical protein